MIQKSDDMILFEEFMHTTGRTQDLGLDLDGRYLSAYTRALWDAWRQGYIAGKTSPKVKQLFCQLLRDYRNEIPMSSTPERMRSATLQWAAGLLETKHGTNAVATERASDLTAATKLDSAADGQDVSAVREPTNLQVK